MTVTVLNAAIRPLLEARLPGWVEPRWFTAADDLMTLGPQAEIGWFDCWDFSAGPKAAALATRLRWLNTLGAGVDSFPLALLAERGVRLTNGAGLNAVPIAEYILMAMLTVAKGWREVVRAQERREWLAGPPGRQELCGSSALILGAGGIGGRLAELLRALGLAVTTVRRSPGPGDLGMDGWRDRLGDFEWVIVLVPSTPQTEGMIGTAELAAMKPDAVLINFARGAVIDQDALVEALQARRIAGAFLDVTTPEPLPADHALWSLDNCHISMHLSGRSHANLFPRAVDRFLANLDRWQRGEPLESQVDLALGY
ncbi:MAG TPA: D-2-hydroxyacid dehydrogenase [Novosphingobium sp.]|nr:D-2-hydroxyacid dehydrogenase [Novosphingobium sp.]